MESSKVLRSITKPKVSMFVRADARPVILLGLFGFLFGTIAGLLGVAAIYMLLVCLTSKDVYFIEVARAYIATPRARSHLKHRGKYYAA